MQTKDTNPKDAVGIRKAPLHHVPSQPILEAGLAMMEGAIKYGSHNYRVAGVRASVYYDAAMRHLMAWWEGQDIDPDSGLPHLAKAMACLIVIRDSIIKGNCVDDRPPSMQDNWQTDLNKKAGDLIDRLPESKPAYTKISRPSFPEDFQMGELNWTHDYKSETVTLSDAPVRERDTVETIYKDGKYEITRTSTNDPRHYQRDPGSTVWVEK